MSVRTKRSVTKLLKNGYFNSNLSRIMSIIIFDHLQNQEMYEKDVLENTFVFAHVLDQ